MKLTEEQKTTIFVAIGEASMSWNPPPKGEFNVTQAEAIGHRLIKKLES